MDVAENIRHAFPSKLNGLRRTGFVEPKIKTLPIVKRKDIVKERVSIGKLQRARYRRLGWPAYPWSCMFLLHHRGRLEPIRSLHVYP
jgi:hypothetical protein